MYKFKDYRKNKPISIGWYVWRLNHKFIDNVKIIFLAKYRERGAGFETVLSPEFDYWDGYRVNLPKGMIEYSKYDGNPPKTGYEILDIVGVDNKACPFCKQIPKWRYSGRYIKSGPTDTNYFYLECCIWFNGFGTRMENPIKLSEKRNKILLDK